MGRRCVALLVACAAFVPAAYAVAGDTRAVVELFTSQGCSSCPPADELLGRLAEDPSLVALSLPIDYWDYLGWKDPRPKPNLPARRPGTPQTRGTRAA